MTRTMNLQLRALILALSLFCLSAWAEEKLVAQEAVVSMHAVKRLVFADPVFQTPAGGLSQAAFLFRRSGDTNRALLVEFSLAGTAEAGADYTRVYFESFEGIGIAVTGSVQSVYFAPGQSVQYALFSVAREVPPERAEFIRLSLIQPAQNGIVAPGYRLGARRCATVWISNQKRCIRSVTTPGGGWACVETRPILLPRAFFTMARCR